MPKGEHRMSIPSTPDWMKYMTEKSCFTYKEMSQIFNVTVASLKSMVSRGAFPKPDTKLVGNGIPRVYWKTATVKAEIERRNAVKGVK